MFYYPNTAKWKVEDVFMPSSIRLGKLNNNVDRYVTSCLQDTFSSWNIHRIKILALYNNLNSIYSVSIFDIK